ncbi:MAG: S1-like domain-containing RNA-binding protein [Bacteroidales bacterium]|nr:S1-like domain-containing RNA-binding protein [Bacteroidales bacterium]MDD7724199.1 S1-like domain-containing RNA-binding protein [Bacteroidales bacterium]
MINNSERHGVRIGRFNTLQVLRFVDFGCYLDGGVDGEILMPAKYMAPGLKEGDDVRVFVYFDSEDRLVATTEKPLAEVGQVAYLTCKEVASPGAFLDWGLVKDLLVPRREQYDTMVAGRSYIVYVFQDKKTGRIAATQWFSRYLDNVMPQYRVGDAAKAIVTSLSPLGYNVVIDNTFSALIYNNDVFSPLKVGDRLTVYVTKVREDDKIDVSPQPVGYAKVDSVAEKIIERLKLSNGELNVGDKTNPELIRDLFGCSKKSFKMTIGTLYREGVIEITDRGIKLKNLA